MLEKENENWKTTNSRISVIIPYYNSEETIFRAIQSALLQTHPVLEIIVIDDGSTSEHKQQLEHALALSKKVRLIRLDDNVGPASARNVGWDASQGDWIAFLDSDDAWHPRKLELQMQAVNNISEPVAMVGSATEIIKESQSIPTDCSVDKFTTKRISKWGLLRKNRFSTPTVVIRADLPLRFAEGRRYSEDYELWLRVSSTGQEIIRLDLPLAYIFKEHFGDSGLSSHMIAMSLGELKTFRCLYKSNLLTFPQFISASVISILKSIRRFGVAAIRKISK